MRNNYTSKQFKTKAIQYGKNTTIVDIYEFLNQEFTLKSLKSNIRDDEWVVKKIKKGRISRKDVFIVSPNFFKTFFKQVR